jgi:predicted metalloprotease with PDZ domain
MIFLLACTWLRIGAAQEPEQPVKMAPYRVEERPFGFLGIVRATIAMNPWKLMVGMKAIRYVQIDELDPQSPGISAGIVSGDRIVSINGVSVSTMGMKQLHRIGSDVEAGQKISLEIFRPRDGKVRPVEVLVPGKAPPRPSSQPTGGK